MLSGARIFRMRLRSTFNECGWGVLDVILQPHPRGCHLSEDRIFKNSNCTAGLGNFLLTMSSSKKLDCHIQIL